MIQVTPVILCGGSGSRLWPLSRTGFPKQFLSLNGENSLFQQAAQRLLCLGNGDIKLGAPLIVTAEDHRFLVVEQLREVGIPLGCALLEPVARNTAPALTLAALAAIQNGSDPVLVVASADQAMEDTSAFIAATQAAIKQATNGGVFVFGVKPSSPETGYGYIQVEAGRGVGWSKEGCCRVKRFVEKPDAATAQQYLAEGGYFWNAGMFVLKASLWLRLLEEFRPDIQRATLLAWSHRSAYDNTGIAFVRPGKNEFAAIPAESVDYAVIEHCPNSSFDIYMFLLEAGWSDLGAWDAVWSLLPKDGHGNVCVGDVLTSKSHNNLVHASSRLVSLVEVTDLVVVETPDAVLVAKKSRSQEVKKIVAQLQISQREEHTFHRKVNRPWGWYDTIDEGEGFKVKRIMVKPGASLSLQKHDHRAEHWVVIAGAAEITNGDKKMILKLNQSTYIPPGQIHRLANLGSMPLEIIEVQSGSYLGEDDIVRLEDQYGRKI